MSRSRSSSRRRDDSSEEHSGEIRKLRHMPAEKRIVESKLNEGRRSQIVDVFAFGANDFGQLGKDPADLGNSPKLNFVRQVSDLNCISYCCAKDSSLVAEANNIERYRNVYSWGGDEPILARDLGEEAHIPSRIEFLNEQPLVQVSCGAAHALALTGNGEIFSWGIYKDNKGKNIGFKPNLGKDEFQDVPEFIEELEDVKITQIACTRNRSLALTETGDVFEWGFTRLDNRTVQRHIADSLLPSKVLMTAKIQAIYAESNGGAVFAESTKGEIFAWGNNQYYQCGIDEEVTVTDGLKNPEAAEVRAKKKREKIATHSRPQKAKQINDIIEEDDIEVKKFSSGRFHSLMLTKSGEVYAWGDNTKGQLGLDLPLEDTVVVPTRIQIKDKIIDVASGPFHTLLLTKGGKILGFGANKDRCLGNLEDIVTVPTEIELSNKKLKGDIVGIACGSRHNLVIAESS